MKNKKDTLNEFYRLSGAKHLIKEEDYDFVRDFKAMYGRSPSDDEIRNRTMPSDEEDEVKDEYRVTLKWNDPHTGDIVKFKGSKSGKTYLVTKGKFIYDPLFKPVINLRDDSGKEYTNPSEQFEVVKASGERANTKYVKYDDKEYIENFNKKLDDHIKSLGIDYYSGYKAYADAINQLASDENFDNEDEYLKNRYLKGKWRMYD